MTTDVLTFFHPGPPEGSAWTFTVRCGDLPPIEHWVFTPKGADPSRFAAASVSTEESLKRLGKDLETLLAQSGGGIFIQAQAHNNVVRIKLTTVPGERYAAPHEMLRLGAAGEPRFETLSQVVDLAAGEHLIVPVSRAAEEKLRTFYVGLKGLPTDLESSILNVMRRPSLEWRIERLERAMSLPPPTQAEWQRSRRRDETLVERVRRIFMWRLPVGPVAAGLLLVAGSVAAFDNLREAEEAPQEPAAVSKAPDTEGGRRPRSPVQAPVQKRPARGAEDGFRRSVNALVSALQEKQDPALNAIYEHHFRGHEADLFGPSSPAIWGVAKLLALQWRLLSPGDPTFSGADRQARVKQVFDTPAGAAALRGSPPAARLLAWGLCKRYGQVAMPKTGGKPTDPYPVPVNMDCPDATPDDAQPGLEQLTAWIKQQP